MRKQPKYRTEVTLEKDGAVVVHFHWYGRHGSGALTHKLVKAVREAERAPIRAKGTRPRRGRRAARR